MDAETKAWVLMPNDAPPVETKVTRTKPTPDNCSPLLEERAEINREKYVFSILESVGALNGESEPSVAIIGSFPAPWKSVSAESCLTNEGIRFDFDAEGVSWTGYYYLGVDTEPTCDRAEGDER